MSTENPTINCACGCGGTRPKYDRKGRERKFIYHHSSNYKHGHGGGDTRSPTLKSYEAMMNRCYYTGLKQYKDYGGRGITVCQEWINSFSNFLRDMGVRPKGTCLGRIDNDGNYCKENCEWQTWVQQANNRRSSIVIKYDGQSMTIGEWAKVLGITYGTLHSRLGWLGWSVKDAMTRPIEQHKRK